MPLMMSARNATAQIATTSIRRIERSASLVPLTASAAGSGFERSSTIDGDAWVDDAIEQIDHEVDDDIDRCDEENTALRNREIAALQGIDQHPADPLPGKDRLDNHRAGEQAAELQTDDRQDGDGSIAKRVPHNHSALSQPLRAGGHDVVFPKHFE